MSDPLERPARPNWDGYFLGIALAVSRRGDCSRRKVGAVLVSGDHRIVSTGYNGVPPGDAGCLESPCRRVSADSPCPGYSDCRSVHAEANALLYANRADCEDSTLYITDAPCNNCLKLIKAARVWRVVWPEGSVDRV